MSITQVKGNRSYKYFNGTAGIIAGVFLIVTISVQLFDYSHNNNNMLMAFPQGLQGGNYTFGIISSIQNNENDNPFWIVSGHWKTNLLNVANQSQTASQGNVSQQQTSAPTFNTSVKMITLNGTGEHTHTITNFILSNVSIPNNMTTVFEGTTTASMRDGPVTDIPTTIAITNGKVISILLDPSKIENHYGDTPIYGIVTEKTDSMPQGNQSGYPIASNNTDNNSNNTRILNSSAN